MAEDSIGTVEGDGPPVLVDEIDELNGFSQADPKPKAQRTKIGGGPDGYFYDAPFDPGYGFGVDVTRLPPVETELPAAAQPNDGAPDPTAPAVVTYPMVFHDATGTWRRQRLPVGAAPADGSPDPITEPVIAHSMVFDGALWDKERGNIEAGLWNGTGADGPRTSSLTSTNQKNRTGQALAIFLHLATTPGTADSVKVRLSGRGKYGQAYSIWESPPFTNPVDRVFMLGAGLDPNYAPGLQVGGVAAVVIPTLFVLSVVHSAAGPAFGYDFAYALGRR